MIAGDLLGREGLIGPRRYLAWGIALFVLKFAIDRIVARQFFGKPWPVFNYLIPLQSVGLPSMPRADQFFYGTMLCVAVPFVWIGIVLTRMRLRDAELPSPLMLMFFLPALNLLFFCMLAVIPSVSRRSDENSADGGIDGMNQAVGQTATVLNYRADQPTSAQRLWGWLLPARAGPSAVVAALLPVPFTLLMTLLAARVFRNYGWGVFVGMPFTVGVISALLHGYRVPRSASQCAGVAVLALLASGVVMIPLAIEGLGCLIMLAPLAIPVAMLGGAFGYSIQARPVRDAGVPNTLWTVLLLLPILIGAEQIERSEPTIFAVVTVIEVNAPPARVWRHVIEFGEIPSPRDWIFRAGIAYPIRARINGFGVGATRYCEFSTGPFVEPIEAWDEGRLLKFAVTNNPPPMREWSPFEIHPPHLENFLVSQGGQFRLIELPEGRTRLEGTTWYRHTLWPETYWKWWSDFIIHRIHLRVLEHVKSLAESDAR